jgi:PleD family two-component response regulator
MNVVELLKALKGDERYKQIPVIMLTSHTDEALVETCFLYGATDCIYKPFHPLVMRQRIQKILG